MPVFSRFKLLMAFFGYTEGYPANIPQMYDISYQLKHEKNPVKQRKLLKQYAKVSKQTSSYQYFLAMIAKEKGQLKEALDFCEKSIIKFPENTLAYTLKAEILQLMAEKTVEQGLKKEPRDKRLSMLHNIDKKARDLRKDVVSGAIDSETFVNKLEARIDEIRLPTSEISKYEIIVNQSLNKTLNIDPKSLRLLCTAEYLMESLFEPLDFSPSAIEFCKAIENELMIKLFEPFKKSFVAPSKLLSKSNGKDFLLVKFVNGNEKLTLGSMATLLQFLGNDAILQKSELLKELKRYIGTLPNPNLLIKGISVQSNLTPQLVNEYRNSSAHVGTFSLSKAKETKEWAYQVLNLLLNVF